MPKIEVTTCGSSSSENTEAHNRSNAPSSAVPEKAAAGLGSDLSSDHTIVKRTSSMSSRVHERKKSIILEVNRFKTFKTFVESKILSKSDRSLEIDQSFGAASNVAESSSSCKNGNGKINLPTTEALSARDNFMRRSSRTSFTDDVDVSLRNLITLN